MTKNTFAFLAAALLGTAAAGIPMELFAAPPKASAPQKVLSPDESQEEELPTITYDEICMVVEGMADSLNKLGKNMDLSDPSRHMEAIKSYVADFSGFVFDRELGFVLTDRKKKAGQSLWHTVRAFYTTSNYQKALIAYLNSYIALDVARQYHQLQQCHDFLSGSEGQNITVDLKAFNLGFSLMGRHLNTFRNMGTFDFAMDKHNPTSSELVKVCGMSGTMTSQFTLTSSFRNRLRVIDAYIGNCNEKKLKHLQETIDALRAEHQKCAAALAAAKKATAKQSGAQEKSFRQLVAASDSLMETLEYITILSAETLCKDFTDNGVVNDLRKGRKLVPELFKHDSSFSETDGPLYYRKALRSTAWLRDSFDSLAGARRDYTQRRRRESLNEFIPFEPLQYR